MPPEARGLEPHEIAVGMTAQFEREITVQDVLDYARISGDHNPLHVDADYAAGTNFEGRIVHGAFQIGLASAMLGMHLPGQHVLLGSVNARFLSPLYFPSRVRVHGEITSWNLASGSGQLKVVVEELSTATPNAEVYMAFTLHEDREQEQAPQAVKSHAAVDGTLKTVLVTGASGGIGSVIAATLAEQYAVLAAYRTRRPPEELCALANVTAVQLDFSTPGWEEGVKAALGGRPLYGIVHAAWPGVPRGGLLQTVDDVLQQQVRFATSHTVGLARLVNALAGPDGGRLVALGSIYGGPKPVLGLAAYSVAKAALEKTLQLLAPELARKEITANAVCPSFVPAGMNKQADERKCKLEAARVPMGRLCSPEDVAAIVQYLLSPGAAFVSGQAIVLSGAQL